MTGTPGPSDAGDMRTRGPVEEATEERMSGVVPSARAPGAPDHGPQGPDRLPPSDAAAHRSRRQALGAAIAAIRATDPAEVEAALQQLGRRRSRLAWLAYVAGTVAVVFDGLVLLIRRWRLTLLQLIPAAWIGAMTWNLKQHVFEGRHVDASVRPALSVAVILVAQLAYWCNATFAFAVLQREHLSIRAAFREARPHWRLVCGLALLTGCAQAALWLWASDMPRFWLALLIMFIVQCYLFVAIPLWLLHVRKDGTRRERLVRSATTGVLAGVAGVPGFLLNRIGLLMLGVGALRPIGVAVLAVATVLEVAASSGVRVVKMSVRLRAGPGDRGGSSRPTG